MSRPFRLRSFAALLGAVVLFTGCLTIEENYSFNKDGSGSMEYVIDMSAIQELMKSMEGLSEGASKSGDLGELDMKDEVKELKAVAGITKVKTKAEKDGYVQRVSFRFKDVDALNRALNVLMKDSTGVQHRFFAWEGNTLVRRTNRFAAEMGADMEGGDGDSTDMTAFLQSMHYKYSFTFAEPIAEVTAADGVARETPSPKQVKLDSDWTVIMKDPGALDLRIAVNKK